MPTSKPKPKPSEEKEIDEMEGEGLGEKEKGKEKEEEEQTKEKEEEGKLKIRKEEEEAKLPFFYGEEALFLDDGSDYEVNYFFHPACIHLQLLTYQLRLSTPGVMGRSIC